MKIKHYAGYGTVTATKVKNVQTGINTKQLVVKLVGNHECGLYRNDTYDIYNWLVKRFAKDCPSYRSIYQMYVLNDYDYSTKPLTEYAIYTIDYFTD